MCPALTWRILPTYRSVRAQTSSWPHGLSTRYGTAGTGSPLESNRARRKSWRNIGVASHERQPSSLLSVIRRPHGPNFEVVAITSAPPLRLIARFFQRRSDAREELLGGPIRGELLGAEHLADRARAIAAGQRIARPRRR